MEGYYEDAAFMSTLMHILHNFETIVTQIWNKESLVIINPPPKNIDFSKFQAKNITKGNKVW